MLEDIDKMRTLTVSVMDAIQWRRQLWGTGARVRPRLPTISFLQRVRIARNAERCIS